MASSASRFASTNANSRSRCACVTTRRNPKLLGVLDRFETDLVAFLVHQAAGERPEADALALKYRLKLLKGSPDRELEASPFGKSVRMSTSG